MPMFHSLVGSDVVCAIRFLEGEECGFAIALYKYHTIFFSNFFNSKTISKFSCFYLSINLLLCNIHNVN
jgi:hypothetical protein